MSKKSITFAGLFCVNVRVCVCVMCKKGLFISLLMLLLALPIVARDSVQVASDSATQVLPMPMSVDTIDNAASVESVAPSPKKQAIDARVEYTSQDSLVMTSNGIAHMYGSGEVRYKALVKILHLSCRVVKKEE